QQLKTISNVAVHRSFIRVSEVLNMSHSTVSLHIRSLEEELGVPLVDRSSRPPTLTKDGFDLAEQASRVLDLIEGIKQRSNKHTIAGSLHIGVVPSASSLLVPQALQRFRARYPEVEITITNSLSQELAQQVKAGKLDLAVTTEPRFPQHGLSIHHVATEPLYVLALGTCPETDPLELLCNYPFIWFSRNTWVGQEIERQLDELGLSFPVNFEMDGLDAIAAMVRHGLGVSIVPKRVGEQNFHQELKAIPFGSPQHSRQLVMLRRKNDPLHHICDALLQELKEVAGHPDA
ncbi:MAG: LysR substrate-binding domain-containing protein, partial [Pseudomonadota bacterium]